MPTRVMKGNATAFTCLGNWYDLADIRSCQDLLDTLNKVRGARDTRTAIEEIVLHANNLLQEDK